MKTGEALVKTLEKRGADDFWAYRRIELKASVNAALAGALLDVGKIADPALTKMMFAEQAAMRARMDKAEKAEERHRRRRRDGRPRRRDAGVAEAPEVGARGLGLARHRLQVDARAGRIGDRLGAVAALPHGAARRARLRRARRRTAPWRSST